ncbi:hypothetical protein [Nocardioides speluncae]|uniref:hypothetical protein n=1 Tax=Nocardioides speluncae TaxID=2670337 RepID=UPI0012B16CBF|nr:hypothetical protein [Nocardioides speluncae]
MGQRRRGRAGAHGDRLAGGRGLPGPALRHRPGDRRTRRLGGAPAVPHAVTGYDDTSEEFTVLYADGRGVARVYNASIGDGVWKQWRTAPGFNQRFTATISEDGDTVTGAWEMSADGETWAVDFDVRYVRVS